MAYTPNKATKSTSAKREPTVRSYSQQTLKILFGTAQNQCAFPNCTQKVIEPGTEHSNAAVIGEIAHIYAASDDGPRGKPGLIASERNNYKNLIVLCPTHHALVDSQHETYTASMLLDWKSQHERKYCEIIGARIGDLGYEELEVAAAALLTQEIDQSPTSMHVIPPAEKIHKNKLGNASRILLTMGAINSSQVAAYLSGMSQLDPSFCERLKSGFLFQYNVLRSKGAEGDELLLEMVNWASGQRANPARNAAGLSLLSHLFIICDVFEK